MNIETSLCADTLKKIVCAIHPHVRDIELTCDVLGCVDQNDVQICIKCAQRLLEDGVTLEEFCRQTDIHLLWRVCEFCADTWPKLRYRERDLTLDAK